MATIETPDRSPAAVLASERMDAAIELATEGRSPYPNGAVFVPADMPELGTVIARHAREYRAVVLVFADGEEKILTAHDVGGRRPLFALLRRAARAVSSLSRR